MSRRTRLLDIDFQIDVENKCRLNRSMQHSSILLIRLCFSKRPDPLCCTQLNLNGAVFSLNQRSRTNLAIETTADWTSGRCCVDPLRPPALLFVVNEDVIYVLPLRVLAFECRGPRFA